MLSFAAKYSDNGKYSQFGEQGIIDECLRRINPIYHMAIEIGAPDFYYCSNTAHLADKGWRVRMFDINPHDIKVNRAEVTPENINDIAKIEEIKGGIEVLADPTVLSIDIDNNDYNIWKAYKKKPDVVVIEVNSSLLPPHEEIPGDRGASYMSMLRLGISKGYFLLCHTGNMVFLLNKHRSLFPEVVGDGIENWKEYFNTSHL